MVFVASIIRNRLCIIVAFFHYFFQISFILLIALMNLTTRGPLCTYLVIYEMICHTLTCTFKIYLFSTANLFHNLNTVVIIVSNQILSNHYLHTRLIQLAFQVFVSSKMFYKAHQIDLLQKITSKILIGWVWLLFEASVTKVHE